MDKYVINHIVSYLKLCSHCNTYQINNYINTCRTCRHFFCQDCKKYLTFAGDHDESISSYCNVCTDYFYYQYKPL